MKTVNFDPRDPTFYNQIINGNMEFWQRGTSFSPAVNGTNYTADRFAIAGGSNAGGAISVTRVTGPGALHSYALRVACTTAQVSVNAAATLSLNHNIEGTFWKPVYNAGGNFVLKFKARSFQTGTFAMQLCNSGYTRIYQLPITFTSPGVWQDFEFIVPVDQGGTWLLDSQLGLQLRMSLVCGSSGLSSEALAWSNTSTIRGLTGQNNFLSSTSNFIEIAAYQLSDKVVSNAFSFAGSNLANELLLCQRYYEKSYPLDIAPGTAAQSGTAVRQNAHGTCNYLAMSFYFKARKRIVPACNVYNSETGTAGQFRVDAANIVASPTNTSTDVMTACIGNVSTSVNSFATAHYSADAEL